MERILITGATGFLGKKLAERLIEKGIHPYCTATRADSQNSVHAMDLTNAKDVLQTIETVKPTTVFHIGAVVNLARDQQTAEECMEVNIRGTFNLLSALRVHVPQKLIFASTEEIYGDNPLPFREDQLPRPPSMYAVTKVAGEQLCALFAMETGCPVRVVRLATMYGPGNPLKRLIPTFIVKALKQELLPLNSGTKKRDYLYIDDAVDMLMKLQEVSLPETVLTVNAGGGTNYSLAYVAERIIALAGSTSSMVTGAFPDRANEADEWLMDNSRAQKLFGWSPRTTLDTGLARTVDFFRKSVL